MPEWCIAPSMSLPLVSPPLLFSEPSDTVPWRSLSPGGRGEGLQKSRTRSSCALSVSVRPLSHNFTRARIRHAATFPFPVAQHSSPQTDGKGLKVKKRKTDEGTNARERKLSCRQPLCECGEKNAKGCSILHLHMTGAPHRLWALRIIQHRCGARERERCGREQECGGAQRESERKKGGVRMGECDKACSSKREEERKRDRLRMFPPSSRDENVSSRVTKSTVSIRPLTHADRQIFTSLHAHEGPFGDEGFQHQRRWQADTTRWTKKQRHN